MEIRIPRPRNFTCGARAERPELSGWRADWRMVGGGVGGGPKGDNSKEPSVHVREFGLPPICQRFPDFCFSFITKKLIESWHKIVEFLFY